MKALLDYRSPRDGKPLSELALSDLHRVRGVEEELRKQSYPASVLAEILDLMISQSYYLGGRLGKFKQKLKLEGVDRSQLAPDVLKTPRWRTLLADSKTRRNDMTRKVDLFLLQLGTHSLLEWLDERHKRREEKDPALKEIGFGEKGIDILLRDCGYLDRAPIDIHEQRFLIRTGLFHRYSKRCDPLTKSDYHIALSTFCRHELTGLELGGYKLDQSPGLVDWIIWYFSSKKHGNVCGKRPRCEVCPLTEFCSFGIIKNRQTS